MHQRIIPKTIPAIHPSRARGDLDDVHGAWLPRPVRKASDLSHMPNGTVRANGRLFKNGGVIMGYNPWTIAYELEIRDAGA